MWLMLQNDVPEDFVIATGKQFTVRDFVEKAFEVVGIQIVWEGKGINEKGINKKTGKIIIEIDKKYFRPSEVETLLGNPSKAKRILNWNPNETSFEQLVQKMVESDIRLTKKEISIRKAYD